MAIAQSAERLIEKFLSECRGIGLRFAANVDFCTQSQFFHLKKIDASNHIQQKSIVVVR